MPMIRARRPNRLTQPLLFLLQRCVGRNPLNPIEVDADRHRHHRGVAAVQSHSRRFRIDLGLELLLDRKQEVAAIALELKREQIVGQQTLENLAAPGADAQPVGIGPRDVPEQRRARVRSQGAQRRGDQRQMVVLDEYRRRSAARAPASMAVANWTLTSWYAAQSSLRNCGRTSTM